MKLKIALDIDDVVLDLIGNWVSMYKKRTGIPDSVHIPITQWSMPACLRELNKDEVLDMLNFPGLFYYAKPVEGAITGVRELLRTENYDVYFLTSASHKTEYHEKLRWVKDYFGEESMKRVIAVPTGGLKNFVGQLFDVLVDDCPANMTAIAQISPKPHCILFDCSHNRDAMQGVDFHERAVGWEDLLKKIELAFAFKGIRFES